MIGRLVILALMLGSLTGLAACTDREERQSDSDVEQGIARSLADVEAARQAMAGEGMAAEVAEEAAS